MNITQIAVVGAGTMGQGIAQWFAQQKITAHLVDIDPTVSEKAVSNIHESWEKLENKGKFTSLEVAQFKKKLNSSSLDQIADTNLLIEAIVENAQIKIDFFKKCDETINSDCIFASNTSSIPITTIAKGLSLERQKRFLGVHFFNPAPIMKLVEIISGEMSEVNIATDLYRWFEERGKMPAQCVDSPGFIVNRVARNFYGESLRLANEDKEENYIEIDRVLKEVGGFKMGPFELMDLIGIDINYAVTESVWKSFQKEPRFEPHPLQKLMVTSERLGRKTKKGFYSYE